MFQKIKVFFFIVLFFLFPTAYSAVITLHVPIIDESPQQHIFFYELLDTALRDIGYTPAFIPTQLPQQRIKNYLNDGRISIYWLLENQELNKKYIPIEVGLTDGLIGKRVLLIKKGEQFLYDEVKTLNDFKKLNLVAGMGRDWFDVNIWKENDLKFKESSGNWKSIFKMIPYGRDYNYISRGINEISVEAEQYPNLAIEDKLVFIYDLDFRFYISKTGTNAGAKYKDIIELAIKNAEKSGLIQRLINKHWPNIFEALNYEKRIKINLEMPN